MLMFPRAAINLVLVLVLLPLWVGCTLTDRQKPMALPAEVRESRFIDDNQPQLLEDSTDPAMIAAMKNPPRRVCDADCQIAQKARPSYNVLAISGGGSYGVFDVGVLNGWTESGTRPVFDMVTGISTGAFISTFAFLGPKYDQMLHDAYVYARAEDIYKLRSWIAILFHDSLANSSPLKNKIDEAITPEVIEEVAKAHRAGRRLYVGTTNLDTRRFVIWDMGAIASSGRPDAIDLYRKVIFASGSVPGFFPPVLIDVEVNGKKYRELHVDGGSTTSVFVPMTVGKCDPNNPHLRPGSNVYVMLSGKLYADSATVKKTFISITRNSITSMLYSVARADVFRIYNQALTCGMEFHLTAIPQTVPLKPGSLSFEPRELQQLFEIGREMGLSPNGWRHVPPGAELSELTVPRTGTKFRTEK